MNDKYRFWDDDGLKIRTCKFCEISEAQSPVDQEWVAYLTRERMVFISNYFNEHKKLPPKCENCGF